MTALRLLLVSVEEASCDGAIPETVAMVVWLSIMILAVVPILS